MRRVLWLAAGLGIGCSAAGANAVLNTAVGAAVAGARRSNGECYVPCTPGNVCNPQSGLCEPLPCRGECRFGEVCEQQPTGDRCVPEASAAPLQLRQSSATVTPAAPSPTPDAGMPLLPPSPRLLPR
ncbi:MAG: hypothetical protein JNJ54_20455 [Myxococcaceae bacterium]|nr:hypothetical protein [Myxococcaceae bacterium]